MDLSQISANKLCFVNTAKQIQIHLLSNSVCGNTTELTAHLEYVQFSMNIGWVIQYANTVQAACDCMPILVLKYL